MSKKLLTTLLFFSLSFAALAVVTSYPFPPGLNGEQQTMWTTILNYFTQKSGDTMTGNLTFSDVGEGTRFTEGTVSAQGMKGTLAFQTGVLDTISNSTVTATTRVMIQRHPSTTVTAFTINDFYVTNQVGVGIKIIPKIPETNSFDFFILP